MIILFFAHLLVQVAKVELTWNLAKVAEPASRRPHPQTAARVEVGAGQSLALKVGDVVKFGGAPRDIYELPDDDAFGQAAPALLEWFAWGLRRKY